MRRILPDQDGYILVLGLILMPIFLGFGLLIIDIGRGNNAHSDLAAAADSVALTGARELDGGPDAIARAKDAMELISNNVSMLSRDASDPSIPLVYEDKDNNEFTVVFLDDIPASDDTPIDAAWFSGHATTDSTEAEFVYVRVQSRNLDTAFLNPANLLRGSVPVAAIAVAKSQSAACDVTPLYICNPFEYKGNTYVGNQLQERFAAGDLHGRLIRLHPKGSQTHAPGNFGFLQVEGANDNTSASAKAIIDIFAGNSNPTCYENSRVTTKPGAATAIAQGINVRFDIYDGPFKNFNPDGNNGFPISPAVNVRKGYLPEAKRTGTTVTFDDCKIEKISDDHLGNADGVDDGVYGFPDNGPDPLIDPNNENAYMEMPGLGVPGAYIGYGDWPIKTYMTEVYGAAVADTWEEDIPSSLPPLSSSNVGAAMPSRYDVYRHEIASGLYLERTVGTTADGSELNGESGAALCGPSKNLDATSDPDRRVVFAAIIDCGEAGDGGGNNTYNVNSYASIFLTRPVEGNGTIDVEIVDISGYGGNGTLETFIREEAILVR